MREAGLEEHSATLSASEWAAHIHAALDGYPQGRGWTAFARKVLPIGALCPRPQVLEVRGRGGDGGDGNVTLEVELAPHRRWPIVFSPLNEAAEVCGASPCSRLLQARLWGVSAARRG